MDKIKTIKIKNEDGSISEEPYTISVDARNVDMDNGIDLQDTIGNINIDTDGNIGQQIVNALNKSFLGFTLPLGEITFSTNKTIAKVLGFVLWDDNSSNQMIQLALPHAGNPTAGGLKPKYRTKTLNSSTQEYIWSS